MGKEREQLQRSHESKSGTCVRASITLSLSLSPYVLYHIWWTLYIDVGNKTQPSSYNINNIVSDNG